MFLKRYNTLFSLIMDFTNCRRFLLKLITKRMELRVLCCSVSKTYKCVNFMANEKELQVRVRKKSTNYTQL